jgi:hypothetical protein
MEESGTGSGYDRRTVVRLGGAVIATGALGGSSVSVAAAQDGTGSLTFEDQRSDGESVVLASVSTSVDARLLVLSEQKNDQGENVLFGTRELPGGTDETDLTVELGEQPIETTQVVRVLLVAPPEGDAEALAMDTAVVAIGEDPELFGVREVGADAGDGFNYPYLLYRPVSVTDDEVPLLVQPNNTGTATDEFERHRDAARDTAERGTARRVADQLGVPLLVPVFPRPRSGEVDGLFYTHQLDRDTLRIEDGPLERIDLQLLAMVDHARTTALAEADFAVREKIMLNGFSASGNFADRFTMLHPERVLSVTAGGLNGMALLPLEEAEDRTLNYHVGIADVPEITGESVDLEALDAVNQFLYMGSDDENDTIPFDDAWTSEELRQTALLVYGEDMITERFPFCQTAYERAGVSARFEIIDGVGHSPVDTERLAEFHRQSMNGEEPEGFGEDLSAAVEDVGGAAARFRVEGDLVAGRSVLFRGGRSTGDGADVVSYTWDFGDGETAAGESVEHTFESAGDYVVTLRIVDGNGVQATTRKEVTIATAEEPSEPTPTPGGVEGPTPTPIGGPEPTTTASDPTATPTTEGTTGGSTVTDASGPGFGPLAALLGFGGGIARLLRWRPDEDT